MIISTFHETLFIISIQLNVYFADSALPWEKPNKCAREDSVRVSQNVSLKVE